MVFGGSTWAHGPEDDVTEKELPRDVEFSVTQMPVRRAPQPALTPKQMKLRREVAGPTPQEGE